MNLTLQISALLILVPGLALADYEAGRIAANRGNFAAARREWEPLAEAGDKDAQFSLGRMYARGDGVRKDFKRAFELFSKAAEAGHGRAALNLGIMYQSGDGVVKDLPRAKMWYRRAEAAGVRESWEKLDRLAKVPDIVFEPPMEAASPTPAPVVSTAQQLASPVSSPILEGCSTAARGDKATLPWIGELVPGDSVREAYCKLIKLARVSRISGVPRDSVLQRPFNSSSLGADAASLRLGTLKELIPSAATANSGAPGKISVTSPLVQVDLFEIGKLSFRGTLWFGIEPKTTVKNSPDVTERPKIQAEGGDIALASTLTKVALAAKGNDVAIYGDEVVSLLKKQYPNAKVSDLSSFSESDAKLLAELDAKRAANSASNQLEEALRQDLLLKKEGQGKFTRIIIGEAETEVVITRIAGWMGVRYQLARESAPLLTGKSDG